MWKAVTIQFLNPGKETLWHFRCRHRCSISYIISECQILFYLRMPAGHDIDRNPEMDVDRYKETAWSRRSEHPKATAYSPPRPTRLRLGPGVKTTLDSLII